MKIGVISDTHIPVRAIDIPRPIYEAFAKVDLILHAGDLVSIDVLDKLKKISKVKAVLGNMDHSELIKILPKKEVIAVGKFKIGLIHGYGPPFDLIDRIKNEFQEKMDVIVFGHSHQPEKELKDGGLFFNPGSPTDKVFASSNSFGMLEINDKIEANIIKL